MKRYHVTLQPLSGATSLLKSQTLYALDTPFRVVSADDDCPLFVERVVSKTDVERHEDYRQCIIEVHFHLSILERHSRQQAKHFYGRGVTDDQLDTLMEFMS